MLRKVLWSNRRRTARISRFQNPVVRTPAKHPGLGGAACECLFFPIVPISFGWLAHPARQGLFCALMQYLMVFTC